MKINFKVQTGVKRLTENVWIRVKKIKKLKKGVRDRNRKIYDPPVFVNSMIIIRKRIRRGINEHVYFSIE